MTELPSSIRRHNLIIALLKIFMVNSVFLLSKNFEAKVQNLGQRRIEHKKDLKKF